MAVRARTDVDGKDGPGVAGEDCCGQDGNGEDWLDIAGLESREGDR